MSGTLHAYRDPQDQTGEPWRVEVNGRLLKQEPYLVIPYRFPDHQKALDAGALELQRLKLAQPAS